MMAVCMFVSAKFAPLMTALEHPVTMSHATSPFSSPLFHAGVVVCDTGTFCRAHTSFFHSASHLIKCQSQMWGGPLHHQVSVQTMHYYLNRLVVTQGRYTGAGLSWPPGAARWGQPCTGPHAQCFSQDALDPWNCILFHVWHTFSWSTSYKSVALHQSTTTRSPAVGVDWCQWSSWRFTTASNCVDSSDEYLPAYVLPHYEFYIY